MVLYLVRHGQTEKNKFGIVQGRTECNLSKKGIAGAKELIPIVSKLKIDVVISSPLKRAYDTAKIITEGRYPINIDDRLIERDWGLCEGVSIDEVDTVKCWNFYENTCDNKIERVQDLMARLSEFLESIKQRYPNSNVLVVSHSAVLRAFHYLIKQIPEDGDMSKIEIPNLRIIEYEI